ncbi:hypothetical protein BKI52_28000 [marine bacterium AO1-C]|nr:hypothetical protein BKI52_28000 [marine bacterium AO1-C]
MVHSSVIILSILDAFYSLPLLIYILLFLGFALGMLYLMIKIKKNPSKKTAFWLALFTLGSIIATPIILMLLNNYYWGYGYLHESKVSYLGVSSKYIAISDYKKGGQSRSIHRLYLIDAQHGKILFKKPVGENERVQSVAISNNRLLVKLGEKKQLLSLRGKPRKAFTKSQLKALPELKNGIYKYGYNTHTHQVWVINKAGKKFFYNGTTLKLELEKIAGNSSSNNFLAIRPSNKAYFTTQKNTNALNYCPVTLKGNIRQQLALEGGQPTKQFFIHGRLLQYFPKARVVLLKSYKTTDKKQLLLTAVNLQGRVLWQKTPKDLEVKDFFSNSKIRVSYVSPALYTGDFAILIGGYLIRMTPNTGVIHWKTRL